MRTITLLDTGWTFVKTAAGPLEAAQLPGEAVELPHTWNAADGSTTITKGAVSYTITPEEYTCKVAGGEGIELTHYAYVNDGVTYIPMDFADTL